MALVGTREMQLDNGAKVGIPVYCCSKRGGSFEIVGYVRTWLVGQCR